MYESFGKWPEYERAAMEAISNSVNLNESKTVIATLNTLGTTKDGKQLLIDDKYFDDDSSEEDEND